MSHKNKLVNQTEVVYEDLCLRKLPECAVAPGLWAIYGCASYATLEDWAAFAQAIIECYKQKYGVSE